jgi:hypothetical protein
MFKSYKRGWQAPVRGYPILVLDPRETPKQVRDLRDEPGAKVIFADKAMVVLSRSPSG